MEVCINTEKNLEITTKRAYHEDTIATAHPEGNG